MTGSLGSLSHPPTINRQLGALGVQGFLQWLLQTYGVRGVGEGIRWPSSHASLLRSLTVQAQDTACGRRHGNSMSSASGNSNVCLLRQQESGAGESQDLSSSSTRESSSK